MGCDTPRVYIVILNWNNYSDSVACLDSVFKLDYSNFHVVFVDNASSDSSGEKIKKWAESMGIVFDVFSYRDFLFSVLSNSGGESQMTMIFADRNYGYTGGNNIGLRYAFRKDDWEFVWILNNDTILDQSALSALVMCALRDKDVAILGSKLVYADDRTRVQCTGGGRLSPFLGNSILLMQGAHISDECVKREFVVDYVSGASLFIKREIIEEIGLFDERYFLYWDDVDLCLRARRKGYKLAYCCDSLVYHKEGGTAGRISFFNDYYWVRNGLLFTKKFFPYLLPVVCVSYFLKYTLVRLVRGGSMGFFAYATGTWDFLRGKFGKYGQ